jgi:Bacteriophage tail sheath protein
MPLAYPSPGVYVEEVPSAIKAIAGVSTSTPGFIGVYPDKVHLVAKDPEHDPDPDDPAKVFTKYVDFTSTVPAKTPQLITNFSQFARLFGDLVGDEKKAATADANPTVDAGWRNLAHAVYGFFNNGGSRCWVARVTADADVTDALKAFAAIDEIALVAVPGKTSATIYDALVTHCATTGDRFAIMDGPASMPSDPNNLIKIPADGGVAPGNTNLAAWYFPWIKVFDPATKLLASSGDGQVAVPPSGHVAGIYARVDNDRGVHKAPANEVIRGALDVTVKLSKADQDGLNPAGVNCIRVLNNNILVWGARTVGGDANADLKYINVRRTLLFLRESIDEGTQWVVFEPNTPGLWAKITRNVTAFLTNVWRSGALFGTTAAEAFYVKCDAETNPPELRELGQVVTEIGVAIVRPAEFVIFRLSQFTAPGK